MGEMLARFNAYRAESGLKRSLMTHAGSGGSTLDTRIEEQGYRFAKVTENVAVGQNTVLEVMTEWKNSPRHRANLLNNDVVNVGFAKAVNTNCNSYATYWTRELGRLG
ncbi:unnamed protein product [Peronospora destructor]|uniref:SCP domain-containing protein n=1 Tax=Peronospora destructor TaxID=86335 RepID=A0AAV0UE86_9STRA|nr:unnamed protein product [Peronospora destructor]